MKNKTFTSIKGCSKRKVPPTADLEHDSLKPSTSQIQEIHSRSQREINPDENPKKKKLARVINMLPVTEPIPMDDERANTVPCEEVYETGKYALTHDRRELYALSLDGDQKLLGNRYAGYSIVNNDGEEEWCEVGPRKKDGSQVFVEENGKKVRPRIKRGIYYRNRYEVNAEGEEVYPRDAQNKEYYETDSDNSQYYRKDLQDRDVPIFDIGYAKYANNDERYPRDNSNNEYYMMNFDANPTDYAASLQNGQKFYAKDSNKNEIYPRRFASRDVFVYPYFYDEFIKTTYNPDLGKQNNGGNNGGVVAGAAAGAGGVVGAGAGGAVVGNPNNVIVP